VIRVGDHVRLKAGGETMRVVEVRSVCDGTGVYHVGLLCSWLEEDYSPHGFSIRKAWLSESSVERVDGGS
jgi:uncharacterized protein YodC (DUF2158 family)